MTGTLLRSVLKDSLRSRWVVIYAVFFALITEGLLFFTSGEARAVLGLMNIVLLLLPLGSMMFGTIHIHDSRDFIELVLVQPVKRSSVFHALWLGIVLPFLVAFTLGTSIPLALHGKLLSPLSAVLLLAGNLLTMVFFALAFVVGLTFREKATAMGVGFLVWLLLGVLYDGIILAVTVLFVDYPMEVPTVTMITANPIDLARIFIMLTFDQAALLGQTGAVFRQFYGSALGSIVAVTCLLCWIGLPYTVALRTFSRRDW
ncbi:MAG TPA: ABC transporter permease [Bacteroidetes bacterium]|nr:ABC transporter permease [Bacteroidota bacterium]HRK05072.1 ABC transporter permease [Chlorobiota bacterium]